MSILSQSLKVWCVCLLAAWSVCPVNSQINYVFCGTSLTYNYDHDASGPSNEGYQFLITSNNQSGLTYFDKQVCTVTLEAQSWPAYFAVVLEQLDLEIDPSCSYDWLCLNGIRFCGSRSGNSFNYSSIVPAYNTFTVKFVTDGSNVKTGFKLRITSRRASNQDVAFQPTGLSFAPNDTAITFKRVTLNDLEGYVDYCRKDLMVPVIPPDSIAVYCGDRSHNPQVFNALSCEGETRKFQLISHPPNVSSGYNNDEHCQVQLETQDKPIIVDVAMELFDLELSPTCNLDSVCLKGIKFCGKRNFNHTYSYIVPVHESFTLRFTSDGSNTFTGFRIRLVTREAYMGDVVYEPAGVLYATDDYSITAGTPVTINNLGVYTDSCRPNPLRLLGLGDAPASPHLDVNILEKLGGNTTSQAGGVQQLLQQVLGYMDAARQALSDATAALASFILK